MADTTEISWTDATFNPWIGCTKVSPGCDHCYAATMMDDRYGRVKWGAGEQRQRTSEANWKKPLAWDRKAKAEGRRLRVFCASLADVFDNEVPERWLDDLWALIVITPNIDWQILTKRIGNAPHVMPENVWLGITTVNQEEFDRDWPKLARIHARVRWLSMEPLLGPIKIGDAMPDWIVVGGESGRGARAMEIEWARSLRDQCASLGIPFHFKQWGEWIGLARVGKKKAGHMLDDAEHRAFPVLNAQGGKP